MKYKFKTIFLTGSISALAGFYLTLRNLDPATAPVSESQAAILLIGGLCTALVTLLPAMAE